jgi:hypothetical protein
MSRYNQTATPLNPSSIMGTKTTLITDRTPFPSEQEVSTIGSNRRDGLNAPAKGASGSTAAMFKLLPASRVFRNDNRVLNRPRFAEGSSY